MTPVVDLYTFKNIRRSFDLRKTDNVTSDDFYDLKYLIHILWHKFINCSKVSFEAKEYPLNIAWRPNFFLEKHNLILEGAFRFLALN